MEHTVRDVRLSEELYPIHKPYHAGTAHIIDWLSHKTSHSTGAEHQIPVRRILEMTHGVVCQNIYLPDHVRETFIHVLRDRRAVHECFSVLGGMESETRDSTDRHRTSSKRLRKRTNSYSHLPLLLVYQTQLCQALHCKTIPSL
jgi:hypothetical protein